MFNLFMHLLVISCVFPDLRSNLGISVRHSNQLSYLARALNLRPFHFNWLGVFAITTQRCKGEVQNDPYFKNIDPCKEQMIMRLSEYSLA